MYQAKQGDIVRIDFNPQKDFEQSGTRPALVVSNNYVTKRSTLALVCPITNTSKHFPHNVNLTEQTSTTGSILCHHNRSVDLKARNAYLIEKVPDPILEE